VFSGQIVPYRCGVDLSLIDGSTIRNRQSLWTAQSVIYDPSINGYHEGRRVKILKAWFYVLHV
jgi:hypothetical protein